MRVRELGAARLPAAGDDRVILGLPSQLGGTSLVSLYLIQAAGRAVLVEVLHEFEYGSQVGGCGVRRTGSLAT